MNTVRRSAALASFALLALPSAAAPESVRIYESGELSPDRYQIVARLWVDSARSAFRVPGHTDAVAAVAGLKAEAARRGADALTNVTCLVDDRPYGGGPHFCYGLAIRRK